MMRSMRRGQCGLRNPHFEGDGELCGPGHGKVVNKTVLFPSRPTGQSVNDACTCE